MFTINAVLIRLILFSPIIKHKSTFSFFFLGYNHQHLREDQSQKSPEFYSRTASESNVYLNTFHYPNSNLKDHTFDTLSLDSSDSMETSISACSPDNISRYIPFWSVILLWRKWIENDKKPRNILLMNWNVLSKISVVIAGFHYSASTANVARIEEMERLLKQAHAEKTRLLESRVMIYIEISKILHCWSCVFIRFRN